MSYIETFPIAHSTIMRIYSEREEIDLNPEYQRMGGVWTKEKKQLLIDSIINDYDIPKIYFHTFTRDQRRDFGKNYAVIDGRQRLEAIWDFIEDKFTLSSDFIFQNDESVKLYKLSYSDLAKSFPKIKIKFDSFVLPVIGVMTDDQDLIEDMFSRLNESVPLNAAEKRNAFGGDLVGAIRTTAEHKFFKEQVSFGNRRYQHYEIAAKFLLIEENQLQIGKITDTKKEYLDALAENYAKDKNNIVKDISMKVLGTLDFMSNIFIGNDDLLRAQGNMVIYYLLCKTALKQNAQSAITRQKLFEFKDIVRKNRESAEQNYKEAKFELLEFDRLSQQGTNDASNIRERLRILCEYLQIPQEKMI